MLFSRLVFIVVLEPLWFLKCWRLLVLLFFFISRLVNAVISLCTGIQGCDFVTADHSCLPNAELLHPVFVDCVYLIFALSTAVEVVKLFCAFVALVHKPCRDKLLCVVRMTVGSVFFLPFPRVFARIAKSNINPVMAIVELIVGVPFSAVNVYYVTTVATLGLSWLGAVAIMMNVLKMIKLLLVLVAWRHDRSVRDKDLKGRHDHSDKHPRSQWQRLKGDKLFKEKKVKNVT